MHAFRPPRRTWLTGSTLAAVVACGGADPEAGDDASSQTTTRTEARLSGAALDDQGLPAAGADPTPPPTDDTLYPEIRSGLVRRVDQTTPETPDPSGDPEGSIDDDPFIGTSTPVDDPMIAGELTDGSEVAASDFCAAVSEWDAEWAALEDEILVLVNEVRARGTSCGGVPQPPVGPLSTNGQLRCAARVHSLDMAERQFFDHVNPEGDGPGQRAGGAGFAGRAIGENIAGGSATAEGTMAQWLDSPGHCENIMRSGFTLLGVGYYPGGLYRHTWTQVFGG